MTNEIEANALIAKMRENHSRQLDAVNYDLACAMAQLEAAQKEIVRLNDKLQTLSKPTMNVVEKGEDTEDPTPL